MIKLRNALGNEAYTGPMNELDEDWTPELRSQVNFTNTTSIDGFFFMPTSVFKQAFDKFQEVYYNEDFKTTLQKENSTGKKWEYSL